MKALVFKNRQLRLDKNVPRPAPGRGEALVRVSLAGVCATDLEIVKGYMDFEGVLGHEFVGVVDKVGRGGRREFVDRRVAGEINIGCGMCDCCAGGLARHCPERTVLGILGRDGAFAEYLTLPVENLHLVPDAVSDKEAVFIEPLAAAFEIIEQMGIGRGDRVCVLGDGRLGLLAAQVLAQSAASLTVIGRHPEKLAIMDRLGISTALGSDSPGAASAAGDRFDLVVDCTGAAAGLQAAMELVKPRGTVVHKTTIAGARALDLNRLVINEITLIGSRCGPFKPAIKALEEKKVAVTPLIGKIFPLDNAAEALRQAGRKGELKILIDMNA